VRRQQRIPGGLDDLVAGEVVSLDEVRAEHADRNRSWWHIDELGILLVWLANGSGDSILLAVLAHAAFNVAVGLAPSGLTFDVVTLLALSAATSAVIILTRGRMCFTGDANRPAKLIARRRSPRNASIGAASAPVANARYRHPPAAVEGRVANSWVGVTWGAGYRIRSRVASARPAGLRVR
jgi:hypothetical protein